jgi:uncharacterized membrane protein YccC
MSLYGHVKFGVFGLAVYIQLLPFMYEKTFDDLSICAILHRNIIHNI